MIGQSNFIGRKTVIIFTLFFLISSMTWGQKPPPKETEIHGHTLYTLLKPGDIPAIFDPQFISISHADTLYYDHEPLMVVLSEHEAKAYSTWHLDRHEVVNDYIGGKAIVTTW
ncbi:MAG: DUF3179 domain-containing protein [Candidatus Marinimicrobia bacterium]|nr:DUF3179 domain-containing protein [Candidatus Neomarinimicrobiota bacterium]